MMQVRYKQAVSLFLFLLFLFQFPVCSSTPKNDDQSDPVSLVKSFFKALEKDDVEKMVKLVVPQKLENIKSSTWRELWRKYQVVDIIKVSKYLNPA